jgi:hypothetical protein
VRLVPRPPPPPEPVTVILNSPSVRAKTQIAVAAI